MDFLNKTTKTLIAIGASILVVLIIFFACTVVDAGEGWC